MSARKQMSAQNPCHCWWQLNPASSSVYLQGLFIHSPEVWDSSVDEVSSTFQPPKLGDGGVRASPSPGSLCILCYCGTTGPDSSMHSKILIREAGLMILILQQLIAKAQWLQLQFWVSWFEKHSEKSQFQSLSALLSLLYRVWSLSLPTEQEALSGPTLHMKSERISIIWLLALFFICVFSSI